MNWTMKLPPYSMLNKAKRDTLKSPNVAANRANMGDMLCGQMPPSFRRDSSSGSTFPSAFRFLLRFFVLQKKKIVEHILSNLHKLHTKTREKKGIETFHPRLLSLKGKIDRGRCSLSFPGSAVFCIVGRDYQCLFDGHQSVSNIYTL